MVRARLYFCTNPPDDFRLRVAPRLSWMAAAARMESSLFRRLWRGKEEHLFRVRTARWAGWPAINSRGAHGINKRAVHACVPRRNSREISAPGACCQSRYRAGWLRHGSLISLLHHNTSTISKTLHAALSESCGQTGCGKKPGPVIPRHGRGRNKLREESLLIGSQQKRDSSSFRSSVHQERNDEPSEYFRDLQSRSVIGSHGRGIGPGHSFAREVCIRTISAERELTEGFARRIVSASSARSVQSKGDLCALLEIQKS